MSFLAIDPALALALRGVLSLLLLRSAAHKVSDLASFRVALSNYDLLPDRWVAPGAAALVLAEMSAGLGLWLPGWVTPAAIVAAGLFLLYAGAIAINLARGRAGIDCGCAGPHHRQRLGGGLVVRNAVLAVAASACALAPAAREILWVDTVTITAGGLTLALLYLAVDNLLANDAPRRPGWARDGEASHA